MARPLLVLVLLAACHNGARDEDCAAVRAGLAHYQVGSGSAAVFDTGAGGSLDGLDHHAFHDPEVAAAVKAVLATRWQVYSPYGSDHDHAIERLRDLCR